MASYKVPPGSGEQSDKMNEHEESKPERKIPEFIILDQDTEDETQKLGATPQDPSQMLGSIQTMTKGRQPFYLRILAFFGTFVMLALSTIVLAVLLITLLISLLLLRRSKYMNEQAAVAWRCFKKAMVFSLGCFVCIFNLSMGVGIVLMYFMLTGEKVSSRFVQEFTKHQK